MSSTLTLENPWKHPKPLLITGLPRSGTKFISTKLGIKHEDQFKLKAIPKAVDQVSEASFFAAPHLPHIERATIIHQVRNPLHVIRSLMGIRWWQEPKDPDNKQVHFAHDNINVWIRDVLWRYKDGFFYPDNVDELAKCCAFVEGWSDMIAPYADYRWRVEDWQGEPRNGRIRDESISWDDVTPGVRRLAEEWGYL